MYLKTNFKDVDENYVIGKAIKCVKLWSILYKLPMNYLLNINNITGNINVLNEKGNQVGYIDVAEDKLVMFKD